MRLSVGVDGVWCVVGIDVVGVGKLVCGVHVIDGLDVVGVFGVVVVGVVGVLVCRCPR